MGVSKTFGLTPSREPSARPDEPTVRPEEPSTRPDASPPSPDFPVPRHVAIVMDGNGRWARSHDLPRIEGHRRGVTTVRMVTETAAELGIEAITLYCLSSENWKRPRKELDFLMRLLEQYLVEERRTIMSRGLRLRCIGRRDRLPAGVVREMDRTIEMSRDNSGTAVVLAVDYGGRDEITRAIRSIAASVAAGEITPETIDRGGITESMVASRLDTAGLPEVDLMIRTGGDMRVSNFLLWQLSYAELWWTEKCWPEFERSDLIDAVRDFATRQRRFGGVNVNE